MRKIYRSLVFITSLFCLTNVLADIEMPSACDCETLVVSEEEAANGCPSHVKEKTCPLYRDSETWKERLRRQQENRRLEENIQPRGIPTK